MLKAPSGKDNTISDVERGNDAFVPFIFPWFHYFNCLSTVSVFTNESQLTIRSMPPLAFGIHNEQYDCDVVII